MKRKRVLAAEPVLPSRGYSATWQTVEEILVINSYNSSDGKQEWRYCLNMDTGEHAFWDAKNGTWNQRGYNYDSIVSYGNLYYGRLRYIDGIEDEEGLEAFLDTSRCYRHHWYEGTVASKIAHIEHAYNEKRMEQALESEARRLDRIQSTLPQEPRIEDFVYQQIGAPDYLFYNKETGLWKCTNCEQDIIGKWKHNEIIICPICKKKVTAKRRVNQIEQKEQCYVLQDVSEEYSVERHFDLLYRWDQNGKSYGISEGKTILLYKPASKKWKRKVRSEVYYNGFKKDWSLRNRGAYRICDTNPANRRSGKGYLWPEGINEALENTIFARWSRLFTKMSAAGMKLDYNRLLILEMAGAENTLEMLWEGRFKRLIREIADRVEYWDYRCHVSLALDGESMEEVFGISDRQRINRIRQMDGGLTALDWIRYSEKTGEKIKDETLAWLEQSGIYPDDLKDLQAPMSTTQVANYLRKQMDGSYKGRSACVVLDQWKDYLSMAEVLGKDTSDEMVYRPRELKRRHDEYAEERQKNLDAYELKKNEPKRREAAAKLREEFPQAETVLAEIRDRYEFEDDTYQIIVPRELLEIVTEGAALHHCAGSSNRYYERIQNRETYICFLRKKSEPEQAFYTIEVEPGGTIRQHRGYLDEEPDIEEIRPFLQEWQKEIRKRMKAEDHELARQSEILRRKNIEELMKKGNLRVLRGLEEDFMEAVNA